MPPRIESSLWTWYDHTIVAAVAQWKERWSSKPGVAGSNPAGGMFHKPVRLHGLLFVLRNSRLPRFLPDVTIFSFQGAKGLP